jgi:thiol-disulfide isomerase/thioredoxin
MKSLLQRITFTILASVCSASLYAAEVVDLSQYQGEKAIYIDFWASWCGPCRQSFPLHNKMHDKYSEKGLKIIAVNVDADREDADQFLLEHPANFDVVYDPEGTLAEKFNIQGMPSAVLISRSGEVLSQHIGFNQNRAKHYEEAIQQLLVKEKDDE